MISVPYGTEPEVGFSKATIVVPFLYEGCCMTCGGGGLGGQTTCMVFDGSLGPT